MFHINQAAPYIPPPQPRSVPTASHAGSSVATAKGANVRGKTSPYGFFVKMCYEEHKKKYPSENVLVTEISKKCSEKWKTMSDEEKKRFYELAQKDAERYQAEMAAYGGEDALKKRKRQKRHPNAPKRALSAFFFFSNEKRQEVQQQHPEWKVGNIAIELGKQWKSLTDEERAVYDRKARDDKERYNEEMRNYRDTPSGSAVPLTQPPPQSVQSAQVAGLMHPGQLPMQLLDSEHAEHEHVGPM
jgi:high mobility group protein B1